MYEHGSTLTPAWRSNCIRYKVSDEIIDQSPNFNGTAAEVWEWISNFIERIKDRVITYPWWNAGIYVNPCQ